MKKLFILVLLTFCALFMHGCSSLYLLDGIDRNCPVASKDQLGKEGHLLLQKGVTLKCQVKNYTSEMSCTGITDVEKSDGWVCNNGTSSVMFIFDRNGILENFKFY